MQDAVLNLCRVKLRDQERLDHVGYLEEYPQYPNGKFGDAVPRSGNAGGGGQPGWILKCKGWKTDPNAYIYFTIQEQIGDQHARLSQAGNGRLICLRLSQARQPHIFDIFCGDRGVAGDKTKFRSSRYLSSSACHARQCCR